MSDFIKISSKHDLQPHAKHGSLVSFDCICHNYHFCFETNTIIVEKMDDPDASHWIIKSRDVNDWILIEILDEKTREIYSNWPESFAKTIKEENDERWR